MGNYLDKWKTLFPEVVGGTKRPLEAISDQDEFNTNGFPQFIAQDPVRYDLQNAFLKQFLSNDAWLWVRQQQADQALDRHKDDAQAHPNGVSGNAASATKLQTARSLNLGGAVTADAATFDGTADATINIKTLDATKLKGTASVSTTGNAATASKLATPRALSLTGKAAGSATFDGSANATINVTSVNADTASKATQDGAGNVITNTYLKKAGDTATGDLTAPNFIGHLKGNADTATRAAADNADKLATPRTISLTGNASGSANFDGSGNVSINTTVNESKHAVNADNATNASRASNATKVDCGEDRGSFIINKPGYNDYSPTVGGPYANVTIDSWFGVSFTSQCGGTVPKGKTAVGIDCRNGIVRANSFEGTLNGNASSATHASSADSATNADKVDGIHAASLFYNKGNWDANNWATIGAYQVNGNPPVSDAYGWGQVISSSTNDARFQLYASDQNNNGRLRYRTGWDNGKDHPWNTILDSENYNKYAPTKTGGGASGTWGINITGNADTVDGYHASDLLRTLGGNRTPVITDIFDRAGTIDMSTMSAADKATHKANINKAPNMVQDLWNTDTGIHAYGGDYDISDGYLRGTLKLTQSYKNFDKIMVIGTEDKANFTYYKLWDGWELANAFANNDCFMLITSIGNYWMLVGTAKHGNAIRKLSTDTIWSCQLQNSGIVAIYGIKY